MSQFQTKVTKNATASASPMLEEHERQRCEVWTRVMGYHRPVSSFNHGKKGEFQERVCFRETVAVEHQHMTHEDETRMATYDA